MELQMNQEGRLDLEYTIEGMLDSLIAILRKEVSVYGELLQLSDDAATVLKKAALQLITENNSKMETCILKARMLEDARRKIIKKIAAVIDREEQDINVTILLNHVQGERKAELLELQSTLSQLILAIQGTNDRAKDLLDYSLHYVRGTMNFITGIISTGSDYAKTGKLRTQGINGKLVCREG